MRSLEIGQYPLFLFSNDHCIVVIYTLKLFHNSESLYVVCFYSKCFFYLQLPNSCVQVDNWFVFIQNIVRMLMLHFFRVEFFLRSPEGKKLKKNIKKDLMSSCWYRRTEVLPIILFKIFLNCLFILFWLLSANEVAGLSILEILYSIYIFGSHYLYHLFTVDVHCLNENTMFKK